MKAVVPLSPRAYQVAEECRLGAPLMEYRDDRQVNWKLVGGLLFGGMVCLLSGWCMIYIQLLDIWRIGGLFLFLSFLIGFMSLICLFIGGLLFISGLIGIIYYFKVWMRGERRFYLCEEGLAIVDRKGVRDVVQQEDLIDMQQWGSALIAGNANRLKEDDVSLRAFYTLLMISGKLPKEFREQLARKMMETSWSAILEQHQVGHAVDFCCISIYVEGIRLNIDNDNEKDTSVSQKVSWPIVRNWLLRTIIIWVNRSSPLSGTVIETGERFLSWDEVEMPWIDKSRSTLVISRKGSERHWAVLPLYRVTNADLCLKLIEHILQVEHREEEE